MPPGFLQRRARDYGDPLSLTFFASCPGNARIRSGSDQPRDHGMFYMDPVTLKRKPCYLYSGAKRMKTSHLPRSKNIPSVVLIKQHFSIPKEADVREATVRELKKLFRDTTAIKGKIVGLT